MTLVLTLIGAPNGLALNESALEKLAQDLAAADIQTTAPVWLSKGEAADFEIIGGNRDALMSVVSQIVAGSNVDFGVQPTAHRRKRLLIADMDSTIIQQECIDELADAMGLREAVSRITEHAMRGEIDFEEALRSRAAMLVGLDAKAMETVYRERIMLTPGATTLVATMRGNGAMTALVSGGFTFFTQRIRERTGFDTDQANELLIDDSGQLSGLVASPILGRAAKLEALKDLAAERGLDLRETIAVGDGANDLAMIEAAGLGVSFHAKPAVAAKADVQVIHNDLTALLFLQGYRRDEFITTD
jgi:phosphoserine phosphatase